MVKPVPLIYRVHFVFETMGAPPFRSWADVESFYVIVHIVQKKKEVVKVDTKFAATNVDVAKADLDSCDSRCFSVAR